MTLSFEPYEDDGTPRLFGIPVGALVVRMGEPRDRWLAGGLDRPLYEVTERTAS